MSGFVVLPRGKGFGVDWMDGVYPTAEWAGREAGRLNGLMANAQAHDKLMSDLQRHTLRSLLEVNEAQATEIIRMKEALEGVLDMALIHPETAYKLAHDALAPEEVENG